MWLIIITGATIHGTQPSGRPAMYAELIAVEAARTEDECIYRGRQLVQENLGRYDAVKKDCVPTASIKMTSPIPSPSIKAQP